MIKFIPLNKNDVSKLTNSRKGETKFGECLKLVSQYTSIYDTISNLDVDYVIFGMAEDIGAYGNFAATGTRKAWQATLDSFVNMHDNRFINAKRIAILGHFEVENNVALSPKAFTKRSISKAREIVEAIDKEVTYLVSQIVKADKIPIIIGGGQNNSYGNIKGTALALNNKINAINFDVQADFSAEEGRHSGNGFSYAYAEGFLKRYYIFGLHENHTSEKILKTISKIKDVKYCTFESIAVREEKDFKTALNNALNHIDDKPFGLEIDCAAIEHIPSAANTSTGFSVIKTRQFVQFFAKNKHVKYLHICEAAPKKKNQKSVGELISTLITDFISANES